MNVWNSEKGLILLSFLTNLTQLRRLWMSGSCLQCKQLHSVISRGSREVITCQCSVTAITLKMSGCAQVPFNYCWTQFYCLRSAFIHYDPFFPLLMLPSQEEIRKMTQIIEILTGIQTFLPYKSTYSPVYIGWESNTASEELGRSVMFSLLGLHSNNGMAGSWLIRTLSIGHHPTFK